MNSASIRRNNRHSIIDRTLDILAVPVIAAKRSDPLEIGIASLRDDTGGLTVQMPFPNVTGRTPPVRRKGI
jgi:hypothetical protein